MNTPFRADGEGSVTDSQCYTVGSIRATDPAVKAALVSRVNLFDDLILAIDLLSRYRDPNMPAIALQSVEMTLAAAKSVA